MTSKGRHGLSIIVLLLFGVVPFIATAEPRAETFQYSRGYIASKDRATPPSALRKRRQRALKKTDTPTPSPTLETNSPTNALSIATNDDDTLPFTTSSFAVISPSPTRSPPAAKPTPVTAETTIVVTDREIREDATSSTVNKRKRRLLASLIPLLTIFCLGLAFAALVVVRRRLSVRNETYAELESDGASSASQQSPGNNDDDLSPPIETVKDAPQFVLPRLPNLIRKLSTKDVAAEDALGMHVERLEIADVDQVVNNTDPGVSFFAGALHFTIALEQALQQIPKAEKNRFEDGTPISSIESIQATEGNEHLLEKEEADYSNPADKSCEVALKAMVTDRNCEDEPMDDHSNHAEAQQPIDGKDDLERAFDAEQARDVFQTWGDIGRKIAVPRSGNHNPLEVFYCSTDADGTLPQESKFKWNLRGEVSFMSNEDDFELQHMETAETDVSSSSCSSTIP